MQHVIAYAFPGETGAYAMPLHLLWSTGMPTFHLHWNAAQHSLPVTICACCMQSGLVHSPSTHHHDHEASSSNFLSQSHQEQPTSSHTGSGDEEHLKRQAARRTGQHMLNTCMLLLQVLRLGHALYPLGWWFF